MEQSPSNEKCSSDTTNYIFGNTKEKSAREDPDISFLAVKDPELLTPNNSPTEISKSSTNVSKDSLKQKLSKSDNIESESKRKTLDGEKDREYIEEEGGYEDDNEEEAFPYEDEEALKFEGKEEEDGYEDDDENNEC